MEETIKKQVEHINAERTYQFEHWVRMAILEIAAMDDQIKQLEAQVARARERQGEMKKALREMSCEHLDPSSF